MAPTIWVYTELADGVPTTGSLELLTKARTLGSVSAFVGGDHGDGRKLGAFGAAKVYATGDLAGKLPGPAVAAAMKAVIDGGDAPELIMFPQSYAGRDVASRLSVKLDRTVLTNNVDITVERRRQRDDTDLRRQQTGEHDVHRFGPAHSAVPAEELCRGRAAVRAAAKSSA